MGGIIMFYTNDTTTRRVSVANFMYKVYGWMTVALALSATTAYGVYSTPSLMMTLLRTPFLFYGLMFAQLGLVIFLSAAIRKISYPTAVASFLGYSILLGVTLSTIFVVYQMASIGMVFMVASLMFGSMATYGYVTKNDLTSFGQILGMGLWGLIIAMLVNMFFANPAFDYLLSFVGVVIFTGLTAYDVQKIKNIGYQLTDEGETTNKIALLGALSLYLDFVNLFLHLLRMFGKRK